MEAGHEARDGAQTAQAVVDDILANPGTARAASELRNIAERSPSAGAILLEQLAEEHAEEDPTRASRWLTEAAALWAEGAGDAKRAARALRAALDVCPTDEDALGHLTELYRQNGKHRALVRLMERRAETFLEQARQQPGELSAKRRAAETFTALGHLLRDPPIESPTEAIGAYNRAIATGAATHETFRAARDLYLEADQSADALPLFALERETCVNSEDLVELYREEAAARKLAQDLAGASALLRQAQKLDPDAPALAEELWVSIQERADAGEVVMPDELADAAAALAHVAQKLEKEALPAQDLPLLKLAFSLGVRALAGAARATELVRQAEVLVGLGAERPLALRHAEPGVSPLDAKEAAPLIARLSALAGLDQVMDLHERMVARATTNADRVRAVEVAAATASRAPNDRLERFFTACVAHVATSDPALAALERLARDCDTARRGTSVRAAFAAALARADVPTRDGGRVKASLLRRASLLARRELGDADQAFEWMSDALFARLEGALESLESFEGGLETLHPKAGPTGARSKPTSTPPIPPPPQVPTPPQPPSANSSSGRVKLPPPAMPARPQVPQIAPRVAGNAGHAPLAPTKPFIPPLAARATPRPEARGPAPSPAVNAPAPSPPRGDAERAKPSPYASPAQGFSAGEAPKSPPQAPKSPSQAPSLAETPEPPPEALIANPEVENTPPPPPAVRAQRARSTPPIVPPTPPVPQRPGSFSGIPTLPRPGSSTSVAPAAPPAPPPPAAPVKPVRSITETVEVEFDAIAEIAAMALGEGSKPPPGSVSSVETPKPLAPEVSSGEPARPATHVPPPPRPALGSSPVLEAVGPFPPAPPSVPQARAPGASSRRRISRGGAPSEASPARSVPPPAAVSAAPVAPTAEASRVSPVPAAAAPRVAPLPVPTGAPAPRAPSIPAPGALPPPSVAPDRAERPSTFPSARPRASGDELIADLFEATHELDFCIDSKDAAAFALRLAMDKLAADMGVVHLYDIDGREFVIAKAYRANGASGGLADQPSVGTRRGSREVGTLRGLRTSDTDPLAAEALRTRGTVIVSDPEADPRVAGARWAEVRRALGAPLTAIACARCAQAGRFLGLIELSNTGVDGAFEAGDEHALSYIAERLTEFVAAHGVMLTDDG